jgi:hypothetical protein
VLQIEEENEQLQGQLALVQVEADQLSDLNAKIETAKHVGDLFS